MGYAKSNSRYFFLEKYRRAVGEWLKIGRRVLSDHAAKRSNGREITVAEHSIRKMEIWFFFM